MTLGDRWRVGLHEPIWLLRPSPWGNAAALPAGTEALTPAAAAARLGSWFPEGFDADERTLAAICLSLEGAFPGGDVPDSGFLHATVRRALADGRLVAVRLPFADPGEGFAEEEEEPPTPRRAAPEEKTWVEIVLMDDDEPPQPVAFARYRVELPDHSVREGMLDAGGRARLLGIDPGQCQVSFPGLDARDWRQA